MTRTSSSIRRLLLAVGLVSLCSAAIVLFSPSIEGMLRWPWEARTALVAFFTVALVFAALLVPFVLIEGSGHSGRTDERPEVVRPTPAPGRDLERLLDARLPTLPPLAQRRRIRSQFRRATIRMLVRTTDCSTETAREKLERGTWTDDSTARTFLRQGDGRDPSRLEALVERIRFSRRARRTAQVILTRANTVDRHR